MNNDNATPKPTQPEQPSSKGLDETTCCVSSDEGLAPPRRRSKSVMGLLTMTAMLAGSFGMGYGGRSSYAERHDPDRPKTPEDLERMAAAKRKRERKAARRNSPHNADVDAPAP